MIIISASNLIILWCLLLVTALCSFRVVKLKITNPSKEILYTSIMRDDEDMF